MRGVAGKRLGRDRRAGERLDNSIHSAVLNSVSTFRRTTVKSSRRYDATNRRAAAERTRSRVVAVAHRRFLSDGYAATTIAAVAAEAGVSTQTVYKTFGGKPGLVRAIVVAGLVGEQPVPAYQRSDALQATEPEARKIIRGWGRLVAELTPRVAPLMLVMRDAAVTDRAIAELLETIDDERLARMTDNARRLAAGGHLRADVDVTRAAELMWTYTSPHLYELLVVRRGWSARQFGDFVADSLEAALLQR